MMPTLFSFSGRLSRLPYLVGALVVSFGSIVPAFLLAGFAMALCATRGGFVLAVTLMLAFGIAVIWASFGLIARRCRDIGWDPFVAIGLWLTLQVGDVILAHLVPSLATGERGTGTLAGGLLNLAFLLALLVWPGRDTDDLPAAPVLPENLPRSRVEALRAAMPSAAPAGPIAVMAMARGGLPARSGFGQRR